MNRNFQTMARVSLFILPPLLLLDCSSNHAPLAEVQGQVTFDGQPLPRGTIIFDVPGQRQSTGKIVDGQITEVTTYDQGDGASIGLARIAVFSTADPTWTPPPTMPTSPAEWTPDSVPPTASASRIPAKYNDPRTSQLTWNIEAGTNRVVIELTQQQR